MRFEVRVGKPAAGGGFVGRSPEGVVVFVRHGLPGELVVAEVTEENATFLRADAIEILEASPDRVDVRCMVAGPGGCGGCDYQHVSLETQRRLKGELVVEQLQRIAKLDLPVVVEEAAPGDDGWSWRTRVRLTMNEEGNPSFHRHRSDVLIPVTSCDIATEEVGHSGVFEGRWGGVASIEVFGHPDANATVTSFTTGPDGFSHTPELTDVGIVVDGTILQPPGRVKVAVGNRGYDVAPESFFQVHRSAATTLSQAVLQAAKLSKGDTVADLYSGVGLFAAQLGQRVGSDGRVIAIERSTSAAGDARRNLKDLPQVEVVTGPVSEKSIAANLPGVDVVVLDPSREGAGKAVMTALCSLTPRPRRIVSVSCDAATFARDVKVALDLGWRLSSIRAFDLFPQTEHVELVGVLEPQRR